MWLSKWFVIFVVFSCIGWIYETTYCMIKWKKWENRGFLYGPVCPIYGTGAASVMALVETMRYFQVNYTWWEVFLVCMIGSIFLEYGTSYCLEKIFHARWWDYSYKKFNIHGRVCLPYSIAFGVAGLLITYYVDPFTMKIVNHIPATAFEFLGLLFMLVIGMDIALTASALSDFEDYIASVDDSLDVRMEQFVTNVGEKYDEMSGAVSAKVSAGKERFSREHMIAAVSKMNWRTKSAARRMASYMPKGAKQVFTHNRLVEFLKNYKQETKTENE